MNLDLENFREIIYALRTHSHASVLLTCQLMLFLCYFDILISESSPCPPLMVVLIRFPDKNNILCPICQFTRQKNHCVFFSHEVFWGRPRAQTSCTRPQAQEHSGCARGQAVRSYGACRGTPYVDAPTGPIPLPSFARGLG